MSISKRLNLLHETQKACYYFSLPSNNKVVLFIWGGDLLFGFWFRHCTTVKGVTFNTWFQLMTLKWLTRTLSPYTLGEGNKTTLSRPKQNHSFWHRIHLTTWVKPGLTKHLTTESGKTETLLNREDPSPAPPRKFEKGSDNGGSSVPQAYNALDCDYWW